MSALVAAARLTAVHELCDGTPPTNRSPHHPGQTEEGLLEYFEAIVTGADGAQRDAEAVAVLLRMDVKALLNERGSTFSDWSVSGEGGGRGGRGPVDM